MDVTKGLHELAQALGVHCRYRDGFGRAVDVEPETLIRICAALGAPVQDLSDVDEALDRVRAEGETAGLAPVLVAWDGRLALPAGTDLRGATITLETGGVIEVVPSDEGAFTAPDSLPLGYHRLSVERSGAVEDATVICAPSRAWTRPGSKRSWGLAAHLAALRSARSGALGDLRDLETLGRWVGERGGDLVTVLPLLPTFNQAPAEPSPYAPVSRLFWSELILDLGSEPPPTGGPVDTLDVTRRAAEVRTALAGRVVPSEAWADAELVRYASFRAAERRWGRNWRDWPAAARGGRLARADLDPEELGFHLVAQLEARTQLGALTDRLASVGVRLGLDLAVGVHPDGYDTWRHQELFARNMSVGAPPDPGFANGQDWGFAPLLPGASRRDGHRYVAQSIRHQASVCGVLRIDHVMALERLFWIPAGMGRHQGTYVSYPAEELFAVVTLESVRNRCEIVGENLGTVPPGITQGMARHGFRGMYLSQFADPNAAGPGTNDVAMIGTHDTPTFAGWVRGADIDERARFGLLDPDPVPEEHESRRLAVEALAEHLHVDCRDTASFLEAVLAWLAESEAPLVISWLEDLWLESRSVNLPGTSSSVRPNWQRPMARLLDDVLSDPRVRERAERLGLGRKRASGEDMASDDDHAGRPVEGG